MNPRAAQQIRPGGSEERSAGLRRDRAQPRQQPQVSLSCTKVEVADQQRPNEPPGRAQAFLNQQLVKRRLIELTVGGIEIVHQFGTGNVE